MKDTYVFLMPYKVQRRDNLHFKTQGYQDRLTVIRPIRQSYRTKYSLFALSDQKGNRNGGKVQTAKKPKRKDLLPKMDNMPTQKSRKKASQKDLQALVQTMGLQPVPVSEPRSGVISQPNLHSTSNPDITSLPPHPSLASQLQYARNGHAVFRNLIPSEILFRIKDDLVQYAASQELAAWQQKVEVAMSLSKEEVQRRYATIEECRDILKKSSPDGIVQVPFLQHFNTWRSIPSVKRLVTSCSPSTSSLETSPLVHYAKILLDVPNVKLYQDSLFHKRKNDGPTPWHSDARMAPFDTSKMITFWIPLDYVPSLDEGGTGLLFVNGSHSDFALPFWNVQREGGEYDRLEQRYGGDDGIKDYMPMNVGDVSVHAGWTLHSSNGGIGAAGSDRYALAVTYVDDKAEIRKDAVRSAMGHDEDRRSYEDWVNDVPPRSYFEHPFVPTL